MHSTTKIFFIVNGSIFWPFLRMFCYKKILGKLPRTLSYFMEGAILIESRMPTTKYMVLYDHCYGRFACALTIDCVIELDAITSYENNS